MIRGTTPTIDIELDTSLDLDETEEIWVTFKNYPAEVTFTKEHITVDAENSRLTVRLSQEDTLKFEVGDVEIQTRLLMKNGLAYATNIIETTMDEILKEGVIGE